ncbi:MAG: hypothetical protein JO332_01880 [Planctomycetaceae bacterium]|nr:hypothetical protein [Planctomycetaceae bacterium]
MGSISRHDLPLERAAALAGRIVVARLLEKGAFRFPGSPEVEPQKDGKSLAFLCVQVDETLKGPVAEAGSDLRLFSPASWYAHTHASLIRENVVSYSEAHYRGGLTAAELDAAGTALFFLKEDPAPAGFPPGSAFLAFEGSYDRADRAADVAALLRGPEEFNRVFRVRKGERVRFRDGFELTLIGHSHKRPTVGGPQREWSTVEVRLGNDQERVDLNHDVDPEGRESWQRRPWGRVHLELRGMDPDGSSRLVVWKDDAPAPPAP